MDDQLTIDLPNERLGVFVQYNDTFIDAIMIQQGQQMIKKEYVTIKMDNGVQDPKVVLIVKDIQNDEPYAGSVSIPRHIILEGELNKPYVQWVTLFDD